VDRDRRAALEEGTDPGLLALDQRHAAAPVLDHLRRLERGDVHTGRHAGVGDQDRRGDAAGLRDPNEAAAVREAARDAWAAGDVLRDQQAEERPHDARRDLDRISGSRDQVEGAVGAVRDEHLVVRAVDPRAGDRRPQGYLAVGVDQKLVEELVDEAGGQVGDPLPHVRDLPPPGRADRQDRLA